MKIKNNNPWLTTELNLEHELQKRRKALKKTKLKKLEYFQVLEDFYPDWFNEIGTESTTLNSYVDGGSPNLSPEEIRLQRKLLKIFRDANGIEQQLYMSQGQRDAVRLKVTFYKRFGLSAEEISELVDKPSSSIRHQLKALQKNETLSSDYRVHSRDQYGRIYRD